MYQLALRRRLCRPSLSRAARTQNAALTFALSCDDLSAVLPLLPADAAGTLTITYFSQSRSIWIPAQIAVFALAALLALPTRRRRPWEDA